LINKVSRVAWILNVFARETENLAELVNRALRIVRYILQTSERNKVEIATREPMI
jgi:hypothetical protein